MVKQLVGGGVISQWGVYCKRDPSTEMYPGEEGGGGKGKREGGQGSKEQRPIS